MKYNIWTALGIGMLVGGSYWFFYLITANIPFLVLPEVFRYQGALLLVFSGGMAISFAVSSRKKNRAIVSATFNELISILEFRVKVATGLPVIGLSAISSVRSNEDGAPRMTSLLPSSLRSATDNDLMAVLSVFGSECYKIESVVLSITVTIPPSKNALLLNDANILSGMLSPLRSLNATERVWPQCQ